MATPQVVVQRAAQKPGTETTAEAAGVVTGYRVTLVFTGGTNANMATDWATLVGTNFAAPSVVMSWDRA